MNSCLRLSKINHYCILIHWFPKLAHSRPHLGFLKKQLHRCWIRDMTCGQFLRNWKIDCKPYKRLPTKWLPQRPATWMENAESDPRDNPSALHMVPGASGRLGWVPGTHWRPTETGKRTGWGNWVHFNLTERKLQGDLRALFEYLKHGCVRICSHSLITICLAYPLFPY